MFQQKCRRNVSEETKAQTHRKHCRSINRSKNNCNNRYEPAYPRQAAGDSRSFRPKQTITDCKRSVSNLQSSLAYKEESHAACEAELKLCQSQLNLIEQHAGTAGLGQLAAALKLKPDEANRHQEVARETKLSKRAADGELERAQSEIKSLKRQLLKQQLSLEACVTEAADHDKQAKELTAVLQQQAAHSRGLFTQERKKFKSIAVQKSRLQVKLADAVVESKKKIRGINRRNRVDVKNLLQEISVLNFSSDKASKEKEELELSLSRVQSLTPC